MGQELQRRTPGTVARADPSWPTVASTTIRLWFDRHYGRRARRRSLVLVLSALVAMALGAGVTLAFTQRHTASTHAGAPAPNAIQVAQADRQKAAVWIAREVASNIVQVVGAARETGEMATGVQSAQPAPRLATRSARSTSAASSPPRPAQTSRRWCATSPPPSTGG